MKDYQKRAEVLFERLREINRQAQKFTAPKQNLMALKMIEMDDLKMTNSGYFDVPYHVELTEI